MLSKRHIGLAAVLASSLLATIVSGETPASQPAAPPNAQELRALAESGSHREVVRATQRILALRGRDAAAYDRLDVLRLKAEAHLGLKERQAALATLSLAHKESNEAADFKSKARAIALAALIQKSPDLVYTPRTGDDRTGIDITDAGRRGEALNALLRDEEAALRQAFNEARTELDLPAIEELSQRFLSVQAIELASTGKSQRSSDLADRLAHWTARTVNNSLDGFAANLKRIRAGSKGKRDLSGADVRVLQNIRSTCDRLPGTLASLNDAIARPNILDVQGRSARAANLRDSATRILNREDD